MVQATLTPSIVWRRGTVRSVTSGLGWDLRREL